MGWARGLRIAIAALALSGVGCAGGPIDRARDLFAGGDYARAAEALRDGPARRDRLVFEMERGMVLSAAGDHEGAIRAFLSAADLALDRETRSATRFVASVPGSDRWEPYRAEGFERVLVHTWCALDYAALGNLEDALVECRRALLLLEGDEGAPPHPFTRFLSAVLYEARGHPDDARIETERVVAAGVPEELVRLAPLPAGEGEILVFLGLGLGPVKETDQIFVPPSHRFEVPRYRRRTATPVEATIAAGGRRARAVRLTDVGATAEHDLGRRIAKEVAKHTARLVSREVLSQAAGRRGDIAEVLVRLGFFALSGVDTRGWQTLPADLSVARLVVPEGVYDLGVWVGGKDEAWLTVPGVQVRAGARRFVVVRAVR